MRSRSGSVTTFDVSAAGTDTYQGTFPQCINPSGTIAGEFVDANNVYHGFVRSPSNAITTFDPRGSVETLISGSDGLNPLGAISGYYMDSGGVYHGFTRVPNGSITTFDAGTGAGAGQGTTTGGINLYGMTTGVYANASNVYDGYVRAPDGMITTFSVSAAITGAYQGTAPESLNLKGAVTGQYIDAGNVNHGFVRAADGSITTFDAPAPDAGTGAYQGTVPFANNLAGQVTGYTIDDNGVFHGFVRTP